MCRYPDIVSVFDNIDVNIAATSRKMVCKIVNIPVGVRCDAKEPELKAHKNLWKQIV